MHSSAEPNNNGNSWSTSIESVVGWNNPQTHFPLQSAIAKSKTNGNSIGYDWSSCQWALIETEGNERDGTSRSSSLLGVQKTRDYAQEVNRDGHVMTSIGLLVLALLTVRPLDRTKKKNKAWTTIKLSPRQLFRLIRILSSFHLLMTKQKQMVCCQRNVFHSIKFEQISVLC